MTAYTVNYTDSTGFQKNKQIEGSSKRDAAHTAIQEDNITQFEAEDLSIVVYPAGNPSERETFSASKLL